MNTCETCKWFKMFIKQEDFHYCTNEKIYKYTNIDFARLMTHKDFSCILYEKKEKE